MKKQLLNLKLGYVSGSLPGGFATQEEKEAMGVVVDGLRHRLRCENRNHRFGGFTAYDEWSSKASDAEVTILCQTLWKFGAGLIRSYNIPTWVSEETRTLLKQCGRRIVE